MMDAIRIRMIEETMLRVFAFSLVSGLCLVASARAETPQAPLTFEKDVQPLLKTHCLHCHGEEEELKGGLDLRLKRLMLKGGDSGPAIVAKNAAESYLIQRLRAGEMPPQEAGKQLSKTEIDRIARWIDEGAATLAPEPEDIGRGMLITPADRQFWAFQPVRRPPVPDVKHSEELANPIDAFILNKLEAHDLRFSPPADRRTLIRRLSFDLWGLPPEPDRGGNISQ